MSAPKKYGIQIQSPASGSDRELFLAANEISVADGALIFRNASHQIISAFGPGFWRAVWVVEADGQPSGWLAPAPENEKFFAREPAEFKQAGPAAFSPAPQSNSERAAAAEPFPLPRQDEAPFPAIPDQPVRQAEPMRDPGEGPVPFETADAGQDIFLDEPGDDPLSQVLEALEIYPYLSLEQFASDTAMGIELLEKTILAALSSKAIPHGRVADAQIQKSLDICLPELVRAYKPKKPAEILELLKNNEDTRDADAIQLKVWMLRNPKRKVS